MKHLKQQAYNFLEKFKITDLNVQTLSAAISQQGYTIVEYNRISNSEDVEQLLTALGVKALSLTTGAFTYADGNYRILFIEEGHSDEEQLILLAHEEGHIFCGHMNNMSGIVGDGVLKEQEANTFAHYLLKKDFLRSIKLYAALNKPKTVLIAAAMAVVIGVGTFGGIYFYNKRPTGEFCRTRNGDRYHKPDCVTIAGHKVTYDTVENFEKIGITPCHVCLIK